MLHEDAHVDNPLWRRFTGEVFELTREAKDLEGLVLTELRFQRGTDPGRYHGVLWRDDGTLWAQLFGLTAEEVRAQYDRWRRGEPPVAGVATVATVDPDAAGPVGPTVYGIRGHRAMTPQEAERARQLLDKPLTPEARSNLLRQFGQEPTDG